MLPTYWLEESVLRGAEWGPIESVEVLHEHNFILGLVVDQLIDFCFDQDEAEPARAQALFLAYQAVLDAIIMRDGGVVQIGEFESGARIGNTIEQHAFGPKIGNANLA